jgi:parallel beta-helix repeat protein
MLRRRVTLLLVSSLVLVAIGFGLTVVPETAEATTLHVGGIGPGNYTAIQDAINASNPGDTIYVHNGTYSENIFINRSLSVIGEDRNVTIIDGGKVGDVVNISASFTNFTGFTVMNSGMNLTDKGIEIYSADNCGIFDNNLYSNYRGGIYLWYSDGNNITDNNISSNQDLGIGIHDSNFNVVADNVYWNNSYGVRMTSSEHNVVARNIFLSVSSGAAVGSSDNNSIVENQFMGSDTGIFLSRSSGNLVSNNTILDGVFGINLWSFSDYNYVANNSLSDNRFNGLYLVESNNNTVYNNTLSGSNEGLFVAISNDNVFHNNTVSNNTVGFRLLFAGNNQIYHNMIVNNSLQAEDDSDMNQWDNGYPSGGNYWSDYIGADKYKGPSQDTLGTDGIGDTPYVIDADSRDRYPLLYVDVINPLPPENVQASLTGWTLENVTISWDPSPDESTGFVQMYDVYRSGNYDIGGYLYQLVGSVPNGTHSFVDAYTGEGNPSTYFYVICAVNMTGNFTCAEDQAGKFTRRLSVGAKLVSIPLIQSDETIEGVLQTLSFDKSWFYDSFNQQWKSWVRSKPHLGEFRQLNHTMGLWVNVTASSNLTVAGVVPSNTSIQLTKGWNLVGFPSFNSSYTAADLKSSTGSSRIEGYSPLSSPYYLREVGDLDILEAGYGYWVWVDSDTTWIVKSS